jgi:hypothetical protein
LKTKPLTFALRALLFVLYQLNIDVIFMTSVEKMTHPEAVFTLNISLDELLIKHVAMRRLPTA